MRGRIEYVCEVETPLRSPWAADDFYAALALGDTAPVGTTITLLLDSGYTTKDDVLSANVSRVVSDYGYVEVTAHAVADGGVFQVDCITDTIGDGLASDYAAFLAFAKHLIAGRAIWTPNDALPDVAHHAYGKSITQPKRNDARMDLNFRFNLGFIPAAQASYSTPAITPPSAI